MMDTISSLKKKNKSLRIQIKENNKKIEQLRTKKLKWWDYSYALSVSTMDHYECHPCIKEGSTGTFFIKIIKSGLSVLYSDPFDGSTAILDTLIECEDTGNRYFTQKRFLKP